MSRLPPDITDCSMEWPKRTQAEYIANVHEVQRLRRELEATRAELSNARVARDQAQAECKLWKAKCEEDERQLKQEIDRLKPQSTPFDHRGVYDFERPPADKERCTMAIGQGERCVRKKGHMGPHAFE